MFGIGIPELLLILALALIVVGPDKLPEIARSIAKTLVDLKKTAEGLKESFDEEDNPIKDIKPQLEDAAKNFKESILDEETKTWKPAQELEELKSVIDTTSYENENDPSESEAAGDKNSAMRGLSNDQNSGEGGDHQAGNVQENQQNNSNSDSRKESNGSSGAA